MAKKKSNINKYINGLELNKIYSKISRGSSFIPGVIDDTKLSGRVVKKDGSYKAKPFNKSLNNIRPILEAGFSSRGNFRTNYTAPSPQIYLLDTYTGAAAAYSVRRLSSSYSGSALRVRRSSDNTEQDIGFSGNDLDTATMESFVGANDGFVVTWYDQSGNSNDATNSTAAQQPQIVSSGSTLLRNGIPTLDFDGADDHFYNTSILPSISSLSSFYISSTVYSNAFTTEETVLSFYGATAATIFAYYPLDDVGGNGPRVYFNGNSRLDQNDLSAAGQVISTYTQTAINDRAVYTNGVLGDTDTTSLSTSSSLTNFDIGQYNNVQNWSGEIQEIVVYPDDQSTNRAAIESNINAYFSIY